MLSRQIVRRAHVAAAHSAKPSQGEKVTKIKNGLTVASIDNYGPLSQLVLAFRAGSRYESNEETGLVHHLRNAVGTDSKQYPGLSLVWSTAAAGGNLTSFATRDLFGVTVTVPRDQTSMALSVLGHVAGSPAFKPWDVEELSPSLKADISYRQAYDILFDDIHTAAFRNGGLSRSTYAPAHCVGKIGYKTLQRFADRHLVTGQGIIFASNVEHDRLVSYGEESAPLTEGAGQGPSASPYKGGEFRRPLGGKLAHVIVAGEGAAANNAKAVATQAVLLAALGRDASVNFSGLAGSGAVSKAVAQFGGASSFQAVYQDGGLAGVYIVADGASAGSAVSAAVNAIKSFKATNIEAAKARAATELLRSGAHSEKHALERTAQLLSGVEDGAVLKAIEQVSSSDVDSAAKKLSSKLSIASVGSIHNVPYVDSL